MERRKITLPLTRELARTLHAGDQVLLTGTIYTSRDAGHKRMCEALAKGEKIPFDPTDATIYYVGPTPAKPGEVIGSAGPTTSGRMDAYAPTMMSVGARGMIGKGARLPEVVDAMKNMTAYISEPSAVQVHFLQNASKKQSLSLTKTSEQKHSASFMWKTCRL
ncbi:Tartrate dehydratase beta subunit/Fumarate hydratase class I, C-terminal domain [Ruminococcus sp. SR1/5]|nr:Tartrate dehydratase beta subunit/Fumarate hydratase class I, C-terminal domain [Ruminococcus sp. SR1/5]